MRETETETERVGGSECVRLRDRLREGERERGGERERQVSVRERA